MQGCAFCFYSPALENLRGRFDTTVDDISVIFTILLCSYCMGALTSKSTFCLLMEYFLTIFMKLLCLIYRLHYLQTNKPSTGGNNMLIRDGLFPVLHPLLPHHADPVRSDLFPGPLRGCV